MGKNYSIQVFDALGRQIFIEQNRKTLHLGSFDRVFPRFVSATTAKVTVPINDLLQP
jgi:hypothetical protein